MTANNGLDVSGNDALTNLALLALGGIVAVAGILRVAGNIAAFFHEEAVARPRAGQLGMEDLLGAMIGGGDEIGGSLERDLQLLHLAEIAREAAAGLAGGGEHHIHQGRGGHRAGLSHCHCPV